MAAETLTERRLSRALLARQLLLERAHASVVEALERVGGLQTQYAPSGYVGLWTRLAGFQRADLTQALERRLAIQATLMRMTIHMVSAADFWPMALAVRNSRREWFARVNRQQIGRLDMSAIADTARRELSGGPLKLAELSRRLAARGVPEAPIGWIGLWLDLVRVPPSGTWESRRADVYGLADEWLPQPKRPPSVEDATDHVVRAYLAGFGPAHPADIATFAGLPATTVQSSTERLDVVVFRDEQGKKLVDLRDAPRPPEDTNAPVRFLPTWDATLLVHARRTQILPEEYRPLVFSTRTPHSIGTILVDGQVAGSWRLVDGAVVTRAFGKWPRAAQREIADEAERLAAFHGP